jgi:hypothetical protein
MSDVSLFVEIFPVVEFPALTAYVLLVVPDMEVDPRIGSRLAARLRKAYPGAWLWVDDRILTDSPRTTTELQITCDLLRDELPIFAPLAGLEEDPAWQPSPQTLAEIAIRTRLTALDEPMKAALAKSITRLKNAHAEREHRLAAWSARGTPSVSISIASRLIYDQSLRDYAGTTDDLKALDERIAGLWVIDAEGRRGEIIGALGFAENGDLGVQVRSGGRELDYFAADLRLIVRLPELERFQVDAKQAVQVLQMTPAERAQIVRLVSDVGKEAGVLSNAYNSRAEADRFFSADFEMNLRFGDRGGVSNRVRPYKAETLPLDFARCGPFRLREQYQRAPIKVAVINTLSFKLEDFEEALDRYLRRHFDFEIKVIRERRVRVVSRPNLESAVRVVEKDDPDIILGFFADTTSGDDEEGDEDATAAYIRSLTLGRALPIHVIPESTLEDPDSMSAIVLGILGKTGNAPFVLAEPMEHADAVVGLSIVRDFKKSTGETRLIAIARIYEADGRFRRYIVRDAVQTESALPYVLMRDLFPQREFARQRVVIHYDGDMPDDLRAALRGWGAAIGASFLPVEIDRFGSPRLYALKDGKVVQPPWGSAFKLSDSEALLVSSVPEQDITPQPLHIRTLGLTTPPLAIEQALRGLLVWTLLTYSGSKLPKLPVTLKDADALAYWLRKGGALHAAEGDMPFWL